MRSQGLAFTKNTWLAVTKVAVSIALLVVVSRNVDLDGLATILIQVQLWTVAIAVILIAIQVGVQGLRWRVVISAVSGRMRLGRVVRLTFVGVFFNQVLPSSVGGDAVRAWYLHRDGIGILTAIKSVLLERIWGVLALSLLVFIGMAYLGERIDNAPLRFGLMAVLPLGMLGVTVLAFLDRVPPVVRQWRPMAALVRLGADARVVFLSPGLGARLLVLSIIGHLLSALVAYVLALGLGLELSVWDSLAIIPSALLAIVIPLSFAGWGLREGAMIVMLGYLGMAQDGALAVSIVYGLCTIIASLPGCLFWLQWRGIPDQAVLSPVDGA